MKLGLSSYTFAWAIGVPRSLPPEPLTALQLVERATHLGVHVIQIADNLPLDVLSDTELESLRSAASANDVSIEVGTRGIEPDHLKRYLDIARFFDAPFLRIVVDTADLCPDLPEIVSSLRSILPLFEQAGVRLAIENHDRFTAAKLVELLGALDSPMATICLDTANSYGAQEGIIEVAECLAPWTVNLHVKDYSIRRHWHNMGFVIDGRPAGQGVLDIPWLLDLVRTKGKGSPNAIIELWPAPEASIEETIRKESEWAEQSVMYMRTLLDG